MIILYAIADKGEGMVHKIGEFESVSDVDIRLEMFDRDVVLTLEEEVKDSEI